VSKKKKQRLTYAEKFGLWLLKRSDVWFLVALQQDEEDRDKVNLKVHSNLNLYGNAPASDRLAWLHDAQVYLLRAIKAIQEAEKKLLAQMDESKGDGYPE